MVRVFRVVLYQRGKVCTIGKENIQIPVAVIVEQRYSAGNTVNHRLVGKSAVVEHKIDARTRLPVLELDMRRLAVPARPKQGNGKHHCEGFPHVLRRTVHFVSSIALARCSISRINKSAGKRSTK